MTGGIHFSHDLGQRKSGGKAVVKLILSVFCVAAADLIFWTHRHWTLLCFVASWTFNAATKFNVADAVMSQMSRSLCKGCMHSKEGIPEQRISAASAYRCVLTPDSRSWGCHQRISQELHGLQYVLKMAKNLLFVEQNSFQLTKSQRKPFSSLPFSAASMVNYFFNFHTVAFNPLIFTYFNLEKTFKVWTTRTYHRIISRTMQTRFGFDFTTSKRMKKQTEKPDDCRRTWRGKVSNSSDGNKVDWNYKTAYPDLSVIKFKRSCLILKSGMSGGEQWSCDADVTSCCCAAFPEWWGRGWSMQCLWGRK